MKMQLVLSRVYIEPARSQEAIDRAYETFARQNPAWEAALFDRHFLEHAAGEALGDPYGVEPLDLARAWADQFGTSAEGKQRSVRRAMPAATEFVRLLRIELAVSSGSRMPAQVRWS
jgi:hypothetical protein